MTRYTFGGSVRDLVSTPSTTLNGAPLVVAPGKTLTFYTSPTGTTATSDFFVDNDGDGTYETAASAIVTRNDGYIPAFQGPDAVTILYYDPDPTDAETRRVWLVAMDSNTGAVPDATTTQKGIGFLALDTDVDTGTNATKLMTPANVARAVGNHANSPTAHPDMAAAISALQTALTLKANKVSGLVPLEELPGSESATPSTLAQRRALTAGVAVGSATLLDEAVPLGQVQTLIAAGGGVTSDVRYKELGSQPTSVTATFGGTAVPDLLIVDAATGQKWLVEVALFYQATIAAGIQIRPKLGSASVTNKLANASFESDTVGVLPANWIEGNNNTQLRKQTTGGGQDGTGNMTMTIVNTAANGIAWSDYVPCTAGSVWSTGAYAKLGAGTAHPARADVLFSDATGSHTITGGAQNGTSVTPTTGAWTQTKSENAIAPSWATQVCTRLAYTGPPAINDSVRWDAVQLESGSTLPAYGTTGGGSGAYTVTGQWEGLNTAGSGLALPTILRYPTNSGIIHSAGGLGITTDALVKGSFVVAIGGTNLTGQRIEFEFVQKTLDAANATKLVAGNAVFGRLA